MKKQFLLIVLAACTFAAKAQTQYVCASQWYPFLAGPNDTSEGRAVGRDFAGRVNFIFRSSPKLIATVETHSYDKNGLDTEAVFVKFQNYSGGSDCKWEIREYTKTHIKYKGRKEVQRTATDASKFRQDDWNNLYMFINQQIANVAKKLAKPSLSKQ